MTIQAQKETLSFQAEVKQLMHLVAHSLYSNKEVFLRELISNASDAADKLRFEALSDAALYENDADLKICITFDKAKHTITLQDNGVGMNRDEVIANLGTIAKSGTKEFLNALTGDQAKDSHMIGQFGVGFYSAFVVADKVTVETRRAGMTADQGVYWESNGEGEYVVKNIEKAERGTTITLHLKKDQDEFLDEYRLRNIITKYSDHIVLPIVMKKAEEEGEGENKKTVIKDEVVNRARALWTLPKNEIKEEEYKELYKHIAHDFEDPLVWGHNKVEGKLEYITLLYIPTRAPFDLGQRDKPHGLKLYVKRVFIMDDAEQLLPMYLRFVRGVVDSNDLPLNVSREILQSNRAVESMRSGCINRVLTMLEDLAKSDPEKYQKFWQEFGAVMKEGPAEDSANRERIAKLLHFSSTQSDSEQQTVSLDDYISRMAKDQDKIYYIIADNFTAAKNSPHLEMFRKKGVEVILLSDRIDEWLMTHLNEYQGKKFHSVAKGDVELDKVDEKEKEKVTGEFSSVIEQMKKALGEKVKDIRISHRLTDSPACLVADENDMSAHMQRLLKQMGQNMPASKPIMELNPTHPLIVKLKHEQDEIRFTDWSQILFDQSLLAEGGQLVDPAGFVKRLNNFLLSAFA